MAAWLQGEARTSQPRAWTSSTVGSSGGLGQAGHAERPCLLLLGHTTEECSDDGNNIVSSLPLNKPLSSPSIIVSSTATHFSVPPQPSGSTTNLSELLNLTHLVCCIANHTTETMSFTTKSEGQMEPQGSLLSKPALIYTGTKSIPPKPKTKPSDQPHTKPSSEDGQHE